MRMTEQDVLTHQAKLEASRRAKAGLSDPNEGFDRESELRCAISDFCKAKGWICFAGATNKRTGRVLGEPDMHIMAECGKMFHVELKSKTGKVRLEQLQMMAWAQKLGHTIHIVRSLEEFFTIVGLHHEQPHHD